MAESRLDTFMRQANILVPAAMMVASQFAGLKHKLEGTAVEPPAKRGAYNSLVEWANAPSAAHAAYRRFRVIHRGRSSGRYHGGYRKRFKGYRRTSRRFGRRRYFRRW